MTDYEHLELGDLCDINVPGCACAQEEGQP